MPATSYGSVPWPSSGRFWFSPIMTPPALGDVPHLLVSDHRDMAAKTVVSHRCPRRTKYPWSSLKILKRIKLSKVGTHAQTWMHYCTEQMESQEGPGTGRLPTLVHGQIRLSRREVSCQPRKRDSPAGGDSHTNIPALAMRASKAVHR